MGYQVTRPNTFTEWTLTVVATVAVVPQRRRQPELQRGDCSDDANWDDGGDSQVGGDDDERALSDDGGESEDVVE